MITEDKLEQNAIQWVRETWLYHLHGAVISQEDVAAESKDFRVVVLKCCLVEAVRRPSPKLAESVTLMKLAKPLQKKFL